MIAADEPRLPRIDDPPPNLALMVIGKARATAYRSSTKEPLPRTLAAIVREIERRERPGPKLPARAYSLVGEFIDRFAKCIPLHIRIFKRRVLRPSPIAGEGGQRGWRRRDKQGAHSIRSAPPTPLAYGIHTSL